MLLQRSLKGRVQVASQVLLGRPEIHTLPRKAQLSIKKPVHLGLTDFLFEHFNYTDLMIKLVQINEKNRKNPWSKLLDELLKLMKEDTGVCEAAVSKSLEEKRKTAACR